VGIYIKITVIGFSAIGMWAILATTACQTGQVTNGAVNAPANTAAANTSKNSTASNATNTTTEPSEAVDLSTPTAAYKTAYNARKNKDLSVLKRVLSKDVQDFLTEIGKADEKDKKSLDDMLKDLCEQPQAPTAEARNEKINGDKATLEYLEDSGSWHSMDLVKENGEWKITIGDGGKPTLDDTKDDSEPKKK
jgi:cytoskeletal protein RodZ